MEPIKAIYDSFWNKDDSFRNEAEMFRNIVCTGISRNRYGVAMASGVSRQIFGGLLEKIPVMLKENRFH